MAGEFESVDWEMEVGTWGADAYLSEESQSGEWSIEFASGATMTSMLGPLFAIENMATYEIRAKVKSVSGATIIQPALSLVVYDENNEEITDYVVYDASTLGYSLAIGSWVHIGGFAGVELGAGVKPAFARVRIEKKSADGMVWDYAGPVKVTPPLEVNGAVGPSSIGYGNWHSVEFDDPTDPLAAATGVSLESNTSFIAHIGGHYVIDATVALDVMPAGTTMRLSVITSSSGTFVGPTFTAGTSGADLSASMSIVVRLNYGEVFVVQVMHDDTSANHDVVGADGDGWRTWARVQRLTM